MRNILLVGLISLLALGIGGFGTWWFLSHSRSEFTNVTKTITAFTPYYFETDTIEGFSLVKDSVNYNDQVLVFTMQNSAGKQLVFTEQRIPNNFDVNSLQGDKEFKTPYGQAFITDGQSRTTGALFTDDKTWILVNAPKPIGGDTMQRVLGALQKAPN